MSSNIAHTFFSKGADDNNRDIKKLGRAEMRAMNGGRLAVRGPNCVDGSRLLTFAACQNLGSGFEYCRDYAAWSCNQY